MYIYIYIHKYVLVYTWRDLHGEATNGSFSSLENEVQYCFCAAPGMQMPRPTPSKNDQSRMRTRPMQVSGNRAKDMFRMLQNLNCHGSYLQPDRSKAAKQIPVNSRTCPAAVLASVGVSNDPSTGAKHIPCKLQERPRPVPAKRGKF